MTPEQRRQRDLAIWQQRCEGETIAVLGERYGLLREKVAQICTREHAKEQRRRGDPLTAEDARVLVIEAKRSLESVELRLEKSGFRDAKSFVYDARLRLAEAQRSLDAAMATQRHSDATTQDGTRSR